MLNMDMVSFLCVLALLSTLTSLAKAPEHELFQASSQDDPFYLSCNNTCALLSRHHKMVLKLRKLYQFPKKRLDGRRLLYISLLMVTMSNDIELNPGPRIPKYPCGSCSKAVRNNQNSIQCDGCGSWHHIECQGMRSEIHEVMAKHESYSWSCMKCGLPNFSSTFFDSSLSSFASSNTFSTLDASHSHTTSTPRKVAPQKNQSQPKLKILNLNCQSIVNKVQEFWALVETEKPDIVVGTESWLHPGISDSEVFPPGYTSFRMDRKSGQRGGGVFILVHENFICTEQPEFSSDCELLWVRLQVAGSHPLYIGAYYKPKEDDFESLVQLKKS